MSKDESIRKLLEEFLIELKSNLIFQKQCRSHVKPGNMINGTRYIDVYISYKMMKNGTVHLHIQDFIDTDPYLELGNTGGMSNKDSLLENCYEIENIETAKLEFIKVLENLLISNTKNINFLL